MSVDAYPLTWPSGWTRTERRQRSRFWDNRSRSHHSIAHATHFLARELGRMGVGVDDLVISTNVRLRLDGLPRSNEREPDDPGVAVYFEYEDEPRVLACDKWDRVACNLWAIAKHVESIRGQERWGVGTAEQAFRGYTALPAGDSWWEVLKVPRDASRGQIQDAFRRLARETHPDHGGDPDEFDRVARARERGLEEASA